MDVRPSYYLQFARSPVYGSATVSRLWEFDSLLRVDASLPTAGDIGKATIQLASPDGWMARLLRRRRIGDPATTRARELSMAFEYFDKIRTMRGSKPRTGHTGAPAS